MTITVLYFAAMREIAGCAEESIVLPNDVQTISDFRGYIAQKHPPARPYMPSVRVAKNEAFAADSDRIHDGDRLALIPPVAGG